MNIMDGIAGYHTEGATQTADDARLFAVRNLIVTHQMAADRFLIPPIGQRALKRGGVALGRFRPVIPFVAILAQRNARTGGMADDVALDDPTLAPVRADDANLFRGRRRPRRGGVAQGETAHGNVINRTLISTRWRLGLTSLNCAQIVVLDALTWANHSGALSGAGWRFLKTRQIVLTPLTSLIAALKEAHFCQSPVFVTRQEPSSFPSGESR